MGNKVGTVLYGENSGVDFTVLERIRKNHKLPFSSSHNVERQANKISYGVEVAGVDVVWWDIWGGAEQAIKLFLDEVKKTYGDKVEIHYMNYMM